MQLSNLEAMGERIKLLEKQNHLLLKFNHKLVEELEDKRLLIPYPKLNRRNSENNTQSMAAESESTPMKQIKKGANCP